MVARPLVSLASPLTRGVLGRGSVQGVAAIPAFSRRGGGTLAPRPQARRNRDPFSADPSLLAAAQEAFVHGRTGEARELLARVQDGRLPPEKADVAAYLRALLTEDGAAYEQALTTYLSRFPSGTFRREATLALAKLRYAGGDYAAAENLLTIFSPGVEQNATGRQGLITRGRPARPRRRAGALQLLLAEAPNFAARAEEAYTTRCPKRARANKRRRRWAALARCRAPPHAPMRRRRLRVGPPRDRWTTADEASVFARVHASRCRTRRRACRTRHPLGGRHHVAPDDRSYSHPGGAFTADLSVPARELRQAWRGGRSVRSGSETPPVFRVRAGAFVTRDQARALGARLRRERGYSYQVVAR